MFLTNTSPSLFDNQPIIFLLSFISFCVSVMLLFRSSYLLKSIAGISDDLFAAPDERISPLKDGHVAGAMATSIIILLFWLGSLLFRNQFFYYNVSEMTFAFA